MTPRPLAAVLRAILDSTEGIHVALREEAEEALFAVALKAVSASAASSSDAVLAAAVRAWVRHADAMPEDPDEQWLRLHEALRARMLVLAQAPT